MTDSLNDHRNDPWTRLIADKLRHLRFGVIQLTIHDSRVVQVDCTERTRLPTGLSPSDYDTQNSHH